MTKNKKEKYWSKYAHSYDEGANYVVGKTLNQALIEKLSKEHLEEVVEFGCGTGYFTKAIAKNAKHVIATDLSDEMLESTKTQLKKFNNLTIQKADCENSSFPSGKFDSVFMANVLHVIENPSNALQESHRILKAEGLLFAVDYTNYDMKLFEKIKLSMRYIKQWGMPPRHGQSSLSPDKLISLVKSAGFKVDEIQLVGDRTKAVYLKCRKIEIGT